MSVVGKSTRCRAKDCNAKIRYILMPSGKSMPVEENKVPVVFVDDDVVAMKSAYVPHWIACVASDKFRKPRAKKKDDKQMSMLEV